MRFAETDETSAQGSFSGGTFTAPTLFNLLDDAKNLGYVTVRGGEYRGMIPAGLNTLVLLSGRSPTHRILRHTWLTRLG